MDVQGWTFAIVGLTFALYIGIAVWAKAKSTGEFYVAGTGVPPLANGMATAADWMSAASFLGMAGIISFAGYDGSVYLMGWTGGYVLLALLLAPYLRKFGKFTVPDFIGDRYESMGARKVAVFCAIFVSFTYVAGQMRGVGIVFSHFLAVPITIGVLIGMAIVFIYAVLGGMKGITYTQVAQYCVLIFAFMVPAIFISLMMADNPIPQLGFGGKDPATGQWLLDRLDGLHDKLGFAAYTEGSKATLDVFCITLALMVGTAGLPHVIIRFYTVPRVRDARISAGWALLFIAILYTTAPAVAVFARTNLIDEVDGKSYENEVPDWFKRWEETGLIAWVDRNDDGVIDYRAGSIFQDAKAKPAFTDQEGAHGQRLISNPLADPVETELGNNELYVDRDIMVLANPEIAKLPAWVIALVAAGGLAAALSTAAGLLMVISSAISHDLLKRAYRPDISEKGELLAARISAGIAVAAAGLLGIYPPDYVAAVVAFAFGLAASSFFPAILLGIFDKRTNRYGAISGMVIGITFTAAYITYFKFLGGDQADWWLGISPEGIGSVGMVINLVVTVVVSRLTPPPSQEVQDLVDHIRVPAGAGRAQEH